MGEVCLLASPFFYLHWQPRSNHGHICRNEKAGHHCPAHHRIESLWLPCLLCPPISWSECLCFYFGRGQDPMSCPRTKGGWKGNVSRQSRGPRTSKVFRVVRQHRIVFDPLIAFCPIQIANSVPLFHILVFSHINNKIENLDGNASVAAW